MEENGVFKTAAFGGFDKKAVLTYIDALNEKFHAAEMEYSKKYEEFNRAQDSQLAHIKKLETQLSDSEHKLTAVAEQLERERMQTQQMQEKMLTLESNAVDLQKTASDGQRELQIQIERSRQLQFKMESLDYKSRKYDELSVQIGDALIEAKRNADQIVSDATGKAAKIKEQARIDLHHFFSELSFFKGDAARLRKSVEEILFVLNNHVDIMQEVVQDVEKRLDAGETILDYTEDSHTQGIKSTDEIEHSGGFVDENMES